MSADLATSTPLAEPPLREHADHSLGGHTPLFMEVPVVSDAYWMPNPEQMDATRRQKPWRSDPHYFTSVSVSLSATVKMLMHGTRGAPDISQGRFNWFEVMGLLIGHFSDRELVLTDSFSLPVAASEVECSMTEGSQIYMANYLEYHRRLGKAEPGCVGWYHTHPDYSCFLSGIDVTTQQGSQRMQDPWVALVIDPVETLRTGQFAMKAFRTYPEGYTPPEATEGATRDGHGPVMATSSAENSISARSKNASRLSRVKELGMHADRYYELPVRLVQSSRDAPLWALLQRHFWPLSLSLSFPFSEATRTCQGHNDQLNGILTALSARLTTDRDASCPPPKVGFGGDRTCRHQSGSDVIPLLYRASLPAAQTACGGQGAEASTRRDELHGYESAVFLERRLLQLTSASLRVRAGAFSLMSSGHPSHPSVLRALRAVSAAAVVPTVQEQRQAERMEAARRGTRGTSLSPALSRKQTSAFGSTDDEDD